MGNFWNMNPVKSLRSPDHRSAAGLGFRILLRHTNSFAGRFRRFLVFEVARAGA